MKIVCIRHGKTAGNLKGAYVGRTDEPLCEKGREELLKKTYPAVDAVFVSPMLRCQQTAAIACPLQAPVVIDELRECDFGRFEGKTWQELSGDSDYQAWIDSGGLGAFPEGESHEGFIARCCEGFRKVYAICEEKNIETAALVVHGGTIMALLDTWSEPHKGYFDWQVKNGAYLVLDGERKGAESFVLRLTEKG